MNILLNREKLEDTQKISDFFDSDYRFNSLIELDETVADTNHWVILKFAYHYSLLSKSQMAKLENDYPEKLLEDIYARKKLD